MTNQHDNSLDLLLGLGLPSEAKSSAGKQEHVVDGGIPFGDLLNNLLMSSTGGATRPMIDSEGKPLIIGAAVAPQASASAESASAVNRDAATPVIPSPNSNPAPVPTLVADPSGSDASSSLLTKQDGQVSSGAGSSSPDKSVIAFNNHIIAELPAGSLVSEISARPAMDGTTVDLPSGRCEIIASQVSNGDLFLTLAASEKGAEPIQIRLPIEALSEINTEPSANPNNRVDLGVGARQSVSVEQLLARLNVKQIEVSHVGGAVSEPENPIKIVINGNAGGREQTLSDFLPRSEMRVIAAGQPATSTDAAVQSDASKSQPVTGETANLSEQTATKPKQPVAQPLPEQRVNVLRAGTVNVISEPAAAIPGMTRDKTGHDPRLSAGYPGTPVMTEEATESVYTPARASEAEDVAARIVAKPDFGMPRNAAKITGGTEQLTFVPESESADPFAGLSGQATAGGIERGKPAPKTVRFSLPDDLQTSLTPNGRSVSIRIEPEHLGPARLSLTISQEKLRARVTVESIEVKTLVERSLDRLTQQLIKAGVEVDRIEVAVDGRQSGNELLERHAQWRRPTMSTALLNDTDTEFNQADITLMPNPTSYEYVGAGGVNLLV